MLSFIRRVKFLKPNKEENDERRSERLKEKNFFFNREGRYTGVSRNSSRQFQFIFFFFLSQATMSCLDKKLRLSVSHQKKKKEQRVCSIFLRKHVA